MKFEVNWKFKSLESLEKKIWQKADNDSYLVRTTARLRKLPLNEFATEDLRIMIGQNLSLPYLIPLALEKLEEDILAEGDYYPGDLLSVVMKSDSEFWKEHPAYKKQLDELISSNLKLIESQKLKLFNQ
jgi:hypothetical protein